MADNRTISQLEAEGYPWIGCELQKGLGAVQDVSANGFRCSALCRLSRRDSDIRNAGHDSGKLDRIAQHAAPMQPSQPAHGIGIASISVTKPGIHLPQKPAARRGRESRDQANANG
jgi:hypothetical protein